MNRVLVVEPTLLDFFPFGLAAHTNWEAHEKNLQKLI